MKKIILSFSMLLSLGASTVFANDDKNVMDLAKETFAREFKGAQFVNWNETKEYSRASFVLGGHRAEAYFNSLGEMQACVRDIFYDQLPLSVMTAIDKQFTSAGIVEVKEISNSDGTNYRVILEDQGKKFRILADAAGNITEKSRLKK